MLARLFGLVAILALLSACEREPEAPPQPADGTDLVQSFLDTSSSLAPYQTGNAYEVNGVSYEPEENFGYSATGVASYYSSALNGALTASGETYSSVDYTAAHRTLPFQTLVRVTRLDTSASIVVRINDRGPFVQGRLIDVSEAAAMALDMVQVGLADVSVAVLEPETQVFRAALNNNRVIPFANAATPTPTNISNTSSSASLPTTTTGAGNHYILVGTYASQTDANAIRDRMAVLGQTTTEASGGEFKVYLGPLSSRLEAQAMLARVFAQGATNAAYVTR